jgi:hypothetical protein
MRSDRRRAAAVLASKRPKEVATPAATLPAAEMAPRQT